MTLNEFFLLAGRYQLGPRECLVFLRMALVDKGTRITIDQLSEALGWSPSKTRQGTRLLLAKSLITEDQFDNYRKGRPAKVYGLVEDLSHFSAHYAMTSALLCPLGSGAGLHSSVDELLLTAVVLNCNPGTTSSVFDSHTVLGLGLKDLDVNFVLELLLGKGWLRLLADSHVDMELNGAQQMYQVDVKRLATYGEKKILRVDAPVLNFFCPSVWKLKLNDNGGCRPDHISHAALISQMFIVLFNEGYRSVSQFATGFEKYRSVSFSTNETWFQTDSRGTSFSEIVTQKTDPVEEHTEWRTFSKEASVQFCQYCIALEKIGASRVYVAQPDGVGANVIVFS